MKLARFRANPQIDFTVCLIIGITIVYGIYGYGPNIDFSSSILNKGNLRAIVFQLILIMSMFELARRANKSPVTSFPLKSLLTFLPQLPIVCLSLSVLVLAKWRLFGASLNGDELAYSQAGVAQSRKIFEEIRHSKFLVVHFGDTKASLILQGIQIAMLFIVGLTFYVILKFRRKPFLFVGLLVIVRIVFSQVFQFWSFYLSAATLPIAITATFHISDFAIRLTQTAFIFLLLLGIYPQVRGFNETSSYVRILIITSLLFIPILSNTIMAIEPTIYFSIFGFMILILVLENKINLKFILILVTVSVMFRSTAVLFIPLVFLFYRRAIVGFIKSDPWALTLVPFVLEVSYQTFQGVRLGTRFPDPIALTQIENPWLAFWEGIPVAIDPISLTLTLFGIFLPIVIYGVRGAAVVSLYILLLCLIYIPAIPKAASGHNKYAIEALMPLTLLGLVLIYIALSRLHTSYLLVASILCMTTLLTLNINLVDLNRLDKRTDNWMQVQTLVNYPLNRVKLNELLRTEYKNQDCVNVGVNYGNFAFITSGFSLADFNRIEDSQKPNLNLLKWGVGVDESIVINFECVIVDNFLLRQKLRNILLEQGFERKWHEVQDGIGTIEEIWINSRFPSQALVRD
jgi:hypothetical protein